MSLEIEFKMNQFGRTLTDRLDGQKAYQSIISRGVIPLILDFSEVIALGSSFGDEVLPNLYLKNKNKLKIKNINNAIRACIKKIEEDSGIKVEFLD
jgi:RNA 3'-terminal phosphate cyclase